MRLTLRTLLAYLDNTLDPQESENLREKLGESGFATQLVQRIRKTLVDKTISAPAPDAKGPVEEANVIGEYLDSTLPNEQVAEIERACLESDAHLAEAAACHQILTIILRQPAEVPQDLRQRIYELPDRKIEDIAASGSFSGVSIPDDPAPLQPIIGEVPTSDATGPSMQGAVMPVGPDDSGVSDAPTRLRESDLVHATQSPAPGMAGVTTRSLDRDTRIYGGNLRPSRIAPWLVSLGLVAVLLFVLIRLFQPLLSPKVAETDTDDTSAYKSLSASDFESSPDPVTTDPETDNGEAQAGEPDDVGAVQESETRKEVDESDRSERSDLDLGPGPLAVPPPESANGEETSGQDGDAEVMIEDEISIDDFPLVDAEAQDEDMQPAGPELAAASVPDPVPTVANDPDSGDADREASTGVPPPPEPGLTTAEDAAEATEGTDVASASPVPPPPAPDAPMDVPESPGEGDPVEPPSIDEDHVEVASVTGDEVLLGADVRDQWVRLKQGMSIVDKIDVVGAPTFRNQVTTDDASITLVGPVQVRWEADDDGQLTLGVDYGRLLIESTEPNASIRLSIGEEPISLTMADPESVVAVGVMYFRAPGLNPLEAENRIAVTGVMLVKGAATVESDAGEQVLAIGEERRRRGNGEPEISTVNPVPAWIDPEDSQFDDSTRKSLLALLEGEQRLEMQLREATMFRRSEVAALAGRSMLAIGQPDVYFGGDGLFNEPRQRSYWKAHFDAVVAFMDRSAEAAELVHDSIVKMDSANASQLLRLLTGYSQNQLVEGGDLELVKMLDSPSMAVRVLALENLQRITGTTLYYRPDEDTAARRANGIKKWETRQRKGDIRWQE